MHIQYTQIVEHLITTFNFIKGQSLWVISMMKTSFISINEGSETLWLSIDPIVLHLLIKDPMFFWHLNDIGFLSIIVLLIIKNIAAQ